MTRPIFPEMWQRLTRPDGVELIPRGWSIAGWLERCRVCGDGINPEINAEWRQRAAEIHAELQRRAADPGKHVEDTGSAGIPT